MRALDFDNYLNRLSDSSPALRCSTLEELKAASLSEPQELTLLNQLVSYDLGSANDYHPQVSQAAMLTLFHLPGLDRENRQSERMRLLIQHFTSEDLDRRSLALQIGSSLSHNSEVFRTFLEIAINRSQIPLALHCSGVAHQYQGIIDDMAEELLAVVKRKDEIAFIAADLLGQLSPSSTVPKNEVVRVLYEVLDEIDQPCALSLFVMSAIERLSGESLIPSYISLDPLDSEQELDSIMAEFKLHEMVDTTDVTTFLEDPNYLNLSPLLQTDIASFALRKAHSREECALITQHLVMILEQSEPEELWAILEKCEPLGQKGARLVATLDNIIDHLTDKTDRQAERLKALRVKTILEESFIREQIPEN